MATPRILIAGIGNVFFGDDAFGVEVVRRLAERTLPPGVSVKDFGIRGFDLACALQEGYDAVIGERGATLSGGERQRLAIARAFLRDAPIVILDEPTSALDSETERLIFDALQRLTRGRTTFVVAHRLSTAQRADRILVLQQGQIIENGTHEELLSRQGHYAHLHNLQRRSGDSATANAP